MWQVILSKDGIIAHAHLRTCAHTHLYLHLTSHMLLIQWKESYPPIKTPPMVSMLSNLASRQGLGISQTKNMAEVMLRDSAMEKYSFHFAVCPSLSFSSFFFPPSFLLPPSLFLSLYSYSSFVIPSLSLTLEHLALSQDKPQGRKFMVIYPVLRRNRSPLGFPGGSDGKESAHSAGDLGSIPELGRSPGEGKDYPLQYSCLENYMNKGTWQATIHGVTKSKTRLDN